MSWTNEAGSDRELFELAMLNSRRARRLSLVVFAGVFGSFAFWLGGSATYSISAFAAWVLWITGAGCLATSFYFAARVTKQHKLCAHTSRSLIEMARAPREWDSVEVLQEGEFVGAYEVLCCDESLVMMSRNRSYVTSVTIRVALMLIAIAIAAAIGAMIVHSGSGILSYGKPVLIFGAVGAVALVLALKRSQIRWYASRDEKILRVESVRWIFVRGIDDVLLEHIESIHMAGDTMAVQNKDGGLIHFQQIDIPQLVGLKLGEEEKAEAEEAIRMIQCERIRKSLAGVLAGNERFDLEDN